MRTALSTSLVLIALHLTSAMLLLGSGLEVTQRSMVVTLDDLPAQRVQALPIERVQTITSALLDTLGRHEIPSDVCQ